MTETETIANSVYDRHMSPEAVALGRLAAEHELEAAKDDTPPWLRYRLRTIAQEYRDAQTVELHRVKHLVRCAVEGCVNHCAGSRYCARCEEELNSQPYSLANLLHETFLDAVIAAWKKLWHD